MKIHKNVASFKKIKKAVVTTGTFDGVHLGHNKILKTLIEVGESTDSETVIITFFPHPRIVLFPDHDLKLINTIDENIELFKTYGVDHLVFQKFDKDFSRITSLEYVRDILCKQIGLKDQCTVLLIILKIVKTLLYLFMRIKDMDLKMEIQLFLGFI